VHFVPTQAEQEALEELDVIISQDDLDKLEEEDESYLVSVF
jgi:hypothetical protein